MRQFEKRLRGLEAQQSFEPQKVVIVDEDEVPPPDADFVIVLVAGKAESHA